MKNQTVSQYINKQPSPQKEILDKLRDLLVKNFPDQEETLKLGVPYYGDKFYLVGLKDHVNLEMSLQNLSKETIQKLSGGEKRLKF